jgi:chitin-binding protein
LAVLGATMVVASGTAVVVAAPAALAHGVAQFPGSRTWLCYQDAVQSNGQLIPSNPACAAAIAQSGPTSLYNWFAVLRSDAGGKTTGYIPDNQLCSGGTGGPYDFTGYNLNRSDWPVTHLTSGSNITINYSNWARHPGTFHLAITRQGWDPSSPLKWSDLTEFASVTNPPDNGGPGDASHWYYWNQAMPSGRSGPAVLYIRWVRSDSNENFFSCSDITFDGGNGQVTGIKGSPITTSAPVTTRGPVTSAPVTSARVTTRGPVTSAPVTTRGPVTSGVPVTTSGPTGGGGGCVATYKTSSQWSNGYQGEVTVKNNGATSTGAWTATLTLPSGQTVTQVWNGTATTSGQTVTVKNANYNGSLGGGASTTFGYLANLSGNLTAPTVSCTLS